MDAQEFMSTSQAAEVMNCSRYTVGRYIRIGVLPAIRFSRRGDWKIRKKDLENLITNGYIEAE